jgi:PKD repeat protein
VYRLTAIGDGPVSIWQTDLDGSRHDFVFDARKGDTATLFRGAGEWGLAIDRGGDGSVDVTLVANTPSVRLPHTATTTEGGSLQLHADAVSPNAAPIDYRWELVSGDGQLSGVRADATYQAADGPATARVRVTASANGTSVSAETTIEIANAPPSAAAGGDLEADWGSPVTLHGSADDPSAADRATLQVHWSFGDGTGADGVEATHLYVMPGTYTATLRVTDKDGATAADEATVTVTVRQTAGAATVGATTTGGGKLSGNLHSDGTETKGELEWRGADERRLRVQSFTAFVRRGDEAWALGTADEGGILVVHLVAGEPPRVEVWLDGVPQPGSGAVAEGAVKVREG